MTTPKKHIVKVIKVGNSIGILLPKSNYDFKDLVPYQDWVKITLEKVR